MEKIRLPVVQYGKNKIFAQINNFARLGREKNNLTKENQAV
jgi:hypothetical protein